jgi:hypothetical protein
MALLILMVVWIVFATSGDMASIVAKKASSVPREVDMAQKFNTNYIFDQLDDLIYKAGQGEYETKEMLLAENDRIYREWQEKFNQFLVDYENAINRRINLAHNLARFSPMAQFQYAAENIAGTGIRQEEHFLNSVNGYSVVYDNFLRDRLGTLPTEWDYIGRRYAVELNGERITVAAPESPRKNFEDEEVPRFVQREPSIIDVLRDILLDTVGLLLWNLALAMGAFLAFNRADVR